MTDADEIGEISVWEGFDSDATIQAVTELYGPRAVTAAAHCALTARCDTVTLFDLLTHGSHCSRAKFAEYSH